MAQRFKDEAGNIWEMGPNGQPSLVAASPAPSLANPKLPGELTAQGLDIRGKQADLAKSPYQLRKEAADASAAELDLKTKQDAYNSAHPKGSNATVLGPDSLKSLSAPDQELVKALADGRLAFPGGFALKAPWWQQKLEQVAAYDPSFDATNYNNRAKARAMLLTGKVGASANALNTAIGHVGMLSGQISGTASHNFTPFNALENSVAQTFGNSGITNFKDTASKLADELESVYRNGGGAEQGVTRQLRNLDPNASLEQKQGIIQNALELLSSKQAANLYQYNIGSGGKPEVDLLDPAARAVLDKFPDIRDKYFAGTPQTLSGHAAALLQHNGGTPPSAPPSGPTDGPPTVGPGGVPHADYSSMVGGPDQSLATADTTHGVLGQTYRNAYDPVGAAALSAFIRKGEPYATAAAYAKSHGFNPPDPATYMAAVAYQRQNPNATPNVEADRKIPTTLGQRLASSPGAAFVAGGLGGGTAGFTDTIGRTLAGPGWDANRRALSDTNPTADFLGNVAGGAAGMLGGEAVLGKLAPGLIDAARASRIAPYLPAASDAAYGGLYGANENPDNPLLGAVEGTAAGLGGGMFARSAMKTAGRVIAPTAGDAAPLYQAGVFPSPGQRAAAMNGPVSKYVGKAINGVEQAMQSVPVLGALPAISRGAARKDFQKGAFQEALSNIGDRLPTGTAPGPQAHAYASGAFTKAYDTARSGMQFVPDDQFVLDSTKFAKDVNNGVLSPHQTQQVSDVIRNAVTGRMKTVNGPLNGDAYKAASSDLSNAITTWGKNPNTADMAHALSNFQTMFDNAARRNSDPQAVAMLDQADKGYASLVRIQRASERGGLAKDAGTFSPVDYAGAVKQMGGGVRSSAYNRGNALGQDYAQAGLSLRDTMPNSGTAERLMTGQVLGGGAMGGITALGGGHALANPVTAGMFAAYAPGVQSLVKKLIAPRERTLNPILADLLNGAGNGLYDRSGAVGRIGAPAALGYLTGQ